MGPNGRILVVVPMEGGRWSWSQQEDIDHGTSGRKMLSMVPTGALSSCHGTHVVTRGHTADTMPFTSLHTQSMHSTWASPKVFTIHS